MGGNKTAPHLDGLPPERAAELARVNKPGLTALRDYLASGQAVAFLGAGVSAPLYPLWTGLIGDLVDAAAGRLDDRQAESLRALASQSPEEVVEIVRTALGAGAYREALRQVLRVRPDPETGRSWTPVQELVCRCAFTAVVTTNYDPDALRVVEVIELLLDADQWQAADDMYQNRCGGEVWKHLPAARLGQRAATAFVATPGRRAACAIQLTTRRLSYYVNEVGLFAMYAGDLVTGREYLSLAICQYRDAGDTASLAVSLRNLAECLGYLGQTAPGQDAATEALACAETVGDWRSICTSFSHMGRLATLVGDTAEAEQHFLTADQILVREDYEGKHLSSLYGTWWADFLALTGRQDSALVLTRRNIEVCRRNGWNEHESRCDRILGHRALPAGDTAAAGEHLTSAAAVFRDGDYLTELATTLADLAEHARVSGDLDAAERYATEAITIAAPRGLVLAHCAALAARARIRATQAIVGNPDMLYSGRDAADAAIRLAVRHEHPWCELDALRAHALLDQAEGIDRGWGAKADALHARLVPPGLDPDPLGTVERLVAEQKAAEAAEAAEESEG